MAVGSRLKFWAWLVGLGTSGTSFLFATFATTKYVDTKFDSAMQAHNDAMGKIEMIRVDSRDNRIMLFRLSQQLGLKPKTALPPKPILRGDHGESKLQDRK